MSRFDPDPDDVPTERLFRCPSCSALLAVMPAGESPLPEGIPFACASCDAALEAYFDDEGDLLLRAWRSA